ncbi:MAG: zinc metalloprotease HtpX [archaeon]|nr:zinc metalloprotease HtpX [archaeon]
MHPIIKTALYLGILTAILLVIGAIFGGIQGLTIAFIFALLMNGFAYFFSDKISLFFYKAKELSSTENPKLHSIVEEVAKKAGIPKPKIFLVQNVSPNAFATGRNPQNSVIAFTTGILSLLNDDELKGVIAHEMSHIKNRDILIASIAGVIAGTIGYLAAMARWSLFFGGDREGSRGNLVGIILLAILIPIITLLIQLAISRSREFAADETGSRFLGTSKGLESALAKLHLGVEKKPMDSANQGTAHMFIVNPFSGKNFINVFMTHPPIEERIKRLQNMKF